MKFLFFLFSIFSFVMRFIDKDGFDIPNISLLNQFKIYLNDDFNKYKIYVKNHPYITNLKVGSDPCLYPIYKILKYKEKENSYEKYSDNDLGYFDMCKRYLKYKINGIYYEYENIYGVYRVRSSYKDYNKIEYNHSLIDFNNKENIKELNNEENIKINNEENIKELNNEENIKEDIKELNNKENIKEDIKELNNKDIKINNEELNNEDFNKEDFNKEDIKENINNNNISYLNIFVFNDYLRSLKYNIDINKNTEFLIKNVNNLYYENNIPIKFNLSGVLNSKEDLLKNNNNLNVLNHYKNIIENIKTEPYNLGTPLSKADLIIILKDDYETSNHKGMSYFNSINNLNYNYLLIYLNKDLKHNIRKIAHELAHSLGVPHDKNTGFIMEKVYNNKSKLKFNDESIKIAKKNIKKLKLKKKINFNKFIDNIEKAKELIGKNRNLGFEEIVDKKLNGVIPENNNLNYYLTVSLFFYVSLILFGIYYLK